MFLIAFLLVMGVGALCYPRRPRTTGVVFIVLGTALLAAAAAGAIDGAPQHILFASGTWVALGASLVWKFRNAVDRASHVAEWTGR